MTPSLIRWVGRTGQNPGEKAWTSPRLTGNEAEMGNHTGLWVDHCTAIMRQTIESLPKAEISFIVTV